VSVASEMPLPLETGVSLWGITCSSKNFCHDTLQVPFWYPEKEEKKGELSFTLANNALRWGGVLLK
jgi:hypothetical protein